MSIFDFFKSKKGNNYSDKASIKNMMDEFEDLDNKLKYQNIPENQEEISYSEAQKERLKFPDEKILVLGIGGGGVNAIARMCEDPVEGVLYGAIGYDIDEISEKIPFKYLFEFIRGGSCGELGCLNQYNFKERYGNDLNKGWIKGLLQTNNKKIFIVTAFGGRTSIYFTKWICEIAKESQVQIEIIGSIPFEFELELKIKRAYEQLNIIKSLDVNVELINAEDLTKNPELNFFNAFSLLDEAFSNKVRDLCNEELEKIGFKNENMNRNNCSNEIITYSYGMARTFADIIIGLNKKEQFKNAEDAINGLAAYMKRFYEQGDNIAFLSLRILLNIISEPELFNNEKLNINLLRNKIFDKQTFENECDKAYDQYCREKIFKLIVYLNEFRRYRSPEEIRQDLFEGTELFKFSHCGPIDKPYFFEMRGATGMNYPVTLFIRAVRKLWDEIITDGILDGNKMKTIMFEAHHKSIEKIGLSETILQDYEEDSPCHPDVFIPKRFGTGPVYVERLNNQYVKSCGEGKGPNAIPNWLEFKIALKFLQEDSKYVMIREYYLPREDYTLPVFNIYEGKLDFRSDDEKKDFIENVKNGNI